MLFGKKTKAFCVDLGEHALLVARLSQGAAPLVVEELREFAVGDQDGFLGWLKKVEGRGAARYAPSRCGIYPARRLIRRQALDPKRIKEPGYCNEIVSQQFRVEAEKYKTMVLNPADGTELDVGKGAPKEGLFCGLPAEDVSSAQEALLALGIYPERLELGSVATLGAVASHQRFRQTKTPVMVLELGEESTQSFIVSADGVEASRPIASGLAAMIPVVQKELGLKDEESAKKLFYSNTFDFTSMGGILIKKLLKELQSSIGFYEVQTGQSIGGVLCLQLPANLTWLGATIASALGVSPCKLDLLPWAESLGVTLAPGVQPAVPDERWLGLFGLIVSHENAPAVSQQKA